MPFREKSAWIMLSALVLGGSMYFYAVASSLVVGSALVPPNLPMIILLTIGLVVIIVAGHIVIGIASPKEANADADEREQKIFQIAGKYFAYTLGAGVLCSLGAYLFISSGDLLFYCVFASLLLAHIVEYLSQVILFRSSV